MEATADLECVGTAARLTTFAALPLTAPIAVIGAMTGIGVDGAATGRSTAAGRIASPAPPIVGGGATGSGTATMAGAGR